LNAACQRALDVDLIAVYRVERILVQALEDETAEALTPLAARWMTRRIIGSPPIGSRTLSRPNRRLCPRARITAVMSDVTQLFMVFLPPPAASQHHSPAGRGNNLGGFEVTVR